jgi:hypothetical protein
MKNLHLLPTDKASRLCINGKNQMHTYITSDEEINLNDYISDGYRVWKWKDDSSLLGRKKIILTTDQDLNKDGVQPIDDEFLEWFIKNPSCEFVETERIEEGKYVDRFADGSVVEGIYENYKIIIPQEEPCSFCEGTGQIVSSTTISGFKTCDCINILQEEPKQTDEKGNPLTFWGGLKKHKKESIEEEAELFAKSRVELDPIYANGLYYGFIQCGMSKWFEAEKIKAQIEENLSVLEMLEIHGTESSIFRVKMRIKQLEKELKTDDNGLD